MNRSLEDVVQTSFRCIDLNGDGFVSKGGMFPFFSFFLLYSFCALVSVSFLLFFVFSLMINNWGDAKDLYQIGSLFFLPIKIQRYTLH